MTKTTTRSKVAPLLAAATLALGTFGGLSVAQATDIDAKDETQVSTVSENAKENANENAAFNRAESELTVEADASADVNVDVDGTETSDNGAAVEGTVEVGVVAGETGEQTGSDEVVSSGENADEAGVADETGASDDAAVTDNSEATNDNAADETAGSDQTPADEATAPTTTTTSGMRTDIPASDGDAVNTALTVTISGTKVWNDEGAADDRPATVTVELRANGVAVATTAAAVAEDGTWTYEFTNVPVYNEAGEVINYTVVENPELENYTVEYVNPVVTVTDMTVTGAAKYEPGNEVNIPRDRLEGEQLYILVKKGNNWYLWTETELNDAELANILYAIDQSGMAGGYTSENIRAYIWGDVADVDLADFQNQAGWLTITDDYVTFTDPSNWSWIAT